MTANEHRLLQVLCRDNPQCGIIERIRNPELVDRPGETAPPSEIPNPSSMLSVDLPSCMQDQALWV
jgi:hypothetical protein